MENYIRSSILIHFISWFLSIRITFTLLHVMVNPALPWRRCHCAFSSWHRNKLWWKELLIVDAFSHPYLPTPLPCPSLFIYWKMTAQALIHLCYNLYTDILNIHCALCIRWMLFSGWRDDNIERSAMCTSTQPGTRFIYHGIYFIYNKFDELAVPILRP